MATTASSTQSPNGTSSADKTPTTTNGHTPKAQKPTTSSIAQSSDPYLSALHSLNKNGFVVLPATLFPTFSNC